MVLVISVDYLCGKEFVFLGYYSVINFKQICCVLQYLSRSAGARGVALDSIGNTGNLNSRRGHGMHTEHALNILIMDDDEIFCNFISRALNRLGYHVRFAPEGAEALRLYEKARKDGEAFDVVILDLKIQQGMDGSEAIGKFLESDPDVRAIVSSGYSNDPMMLNYREYGFRGVLAKPYSIDDLCTTVANVLRVKP